MAARAKRASGPEVHDVSGKSPGETVRDATWDVLSSHIKDLIILSDMQGRIFYASPSCRLYGYEPGKDIDIEIIGLRPGEKLHESLLDEAEGAEPVSQAKLLRIRGRAPAHKRCRDLMAAIEKGLVRRDEREVLRLLHALVPTFSRVLAPAARPASPLPSLLDVEHEPVPVAS